MRTTVLLTLLALLATHASADWPRLRGAKGDGIAEGKVPVKWSDTENLQWKAPACQILW